MKTSWSCANENGVLTTMQELAQALQTSALDLIGVGSQENMFGERKHDGIVDVNAKKPTDVHARL